MTVEGIIAAQCAYELSQRLNVEMPITAQIYRLIEGKATAKEAVMALLNRPLRHESDSNWLEDK
jgi:glycerol-3-phosphate dehydrogenase (NAD(P)+)